MSADVTEASPSSPLKARRQSSSKPAVAGLLSAKEFEAQENKVELELAKGAAKINWKMNTHPKEYPEQEIFKRLFTTPPLKSVELLFPQTGLTITARNLKGVTFQDVFDAIYKHNKKRADDELSEPYLAGFYVDEDDLGHAIVRVGAGKEGAPVGKKKKGGD
ncbi:hypothetical protein TWF506_001271 [Arthrobotrys conoides]|uniref:DUF6699 domain-containing protein n=1 Tax=Arthrobotrys conoides TaxID=74498 RepID=A0AAN8NMG5_9PEZI